MSSYPGRGVGGTAGVGDQLVTVDIDGSSLFRIYPLYFERNMITYILRKYQ